MSDQAGPSRASSSATVHAAGALDRPSVTYVNLIKEAIQESKDQRLYLREIYEAIQTKHPFYTQASTKWKNVIRHCLSITPAFRNLPKEANQPGKGGPWIVDESIPDAFSRRRSRKGGSTSSTTSTSPSTTLKNLRKPSGSESSKSARPSSRPISSPHLSLTPIDVPPIPEVDPSPSSQASSSFVGSSSFAQSDVSWSTGPSTGMASSMQDGRYERSSLSESEGNSYSHPHLDPHLTVNRSDGTYDGSIPLHYLAGPHPPPPPAPPPPPHDFSGSYAEPYRQYGYVPVDPPYGASLGGRSPLHPSSAPISPNPYSPSPHAQSHSNPVAYGYPHPSSGPSSFYSSDPSSSTFPRLSVFPDGSPMHFSLPPARTFTHVSTPTINQQSLGLSISHSHQPRDLPTHASQQQQHMYGWSTDGGLARQQQQQQQQAQQGLPPPVPPPPPSLAGSVLDSHLHQQQQHTLAGPGAPAEGELSEGSDSARDWGLDRLH